MILPKYDLTLRPGGIDLRCRYTDGYRCSCTPNHTSIFSPRKVVASITVRVETVRRELFANTDVLTGRRGKAQR